MTEILFMSVLLVCLGAIFIKFFNKLNPFLILIGLVLFLPMFEFLSTENSIIYTLAFACGVFSKFLKKGKLGLNLVEDVKMSIQLSRARAREREGRAFYQSQSYRQEMEEEKRRMSEEWERIKKAWDDLIKEKEEFEQQKRQHQQKGGSSQQQAKTDQFSTKQTRYFKEFERFDLDDFKNNDPYQVLGVSKEATKQEIKKAFNKLVLKFHPDKHYNEVLDKIKEANKIFILISWAKDKLY